MTTGRNGVLLVWVMVVICTTALESLDDGKQVE